MHDGFARITRTGRGIFLEAALAARLAHPVRHVISLIGIARQSCRKVIARLDQDMRIQAKGLSLMFYPMNSA
jgi:hypothetical protein